jgi:hypothetical protein
VSGEEGLRAQDTRHDRRRGLRGYRAPEGERGLGVYRIAYRS